MAHWMSAQRRLGRAQKKAAAALLLPHIRFPLMRPEIVITYFYAYSWFRCGEMLQRVCFIMPFACP